MHPTRWVARKPDAPISCASFLLQVFKPSSWWVSYNRGFEPVSKHGLTPTHCGFNVACPLFWVLCYIFSEDLCYVFRCRALPASSHVTVGEPRSRTAGLCWLANGYFVRACMDMQACVRIYLDFQARVYIGAYVCVYMWMCICVYVNVYMWMCVYVNVCICECVYVNVCMCLCIQ